MRSIHSPNPNFTVSTVQSLLNVRNPLELVHECGSKLTDTQVDPKLSTRKDDDGRLPIHWAASANQPDIVQLLAEQKGFDVDAKVRMD